jgi:hypothetical protein
VGWRGLALAPRRLAATEIAVDAEFPLSRETAMAENEDPPYIEEKLRFLQNNEVPRRRLGHAAHNFADFARYLEIHREKFRDQINRKVLPSETQILLAEKFGFRVDWPEWSSGTSSAFENRYLKENRHLMESPRPSPKALANAAAGQKQGPARPGAAYRKSWAFGGILVAAGLAILLFWWPRPSASSLPYISHVELFDESKGAIIPGSDANGANPRHTLTALEERSGNDFQIESAERFFFALGFVLHHLVIQPDGGMRVKFFVEGLSNDGGPSAWREDAELGSKDSWKRFDIAKSVKPDAVLEAFKLKEGDGIPIAVVIECRTWEEILRWSGQIQIIVQDLNVSKEKHELPLPFQTKLQKPKWANAETKGCN